MSEPQSDLTTISKPEQARPRRFPKETGSSSAAQRSVPGPDVVRPRALTRERFRESSRRTR
jgi:hypothetical protein